MFGKVFSVCCSVAVLQFQNGYCKSQKLSLYYYIYKYIY